MHQKCSRSFLIGPSNLSSASSFSSSTTSDGRYGTRSHRPLQCTAACRLLPPSLRSRLRDALMLHIRHPTHPPTVHKTHRRRKARLHAHPHPRAARARKSTADSVCERTPVLYTRSHALSLSRATHRKPVHWSGVSSQEPPLPSGSILMPKQQPGDAGKALPTRINVLALAHKTRERWARAHAPHPLVSLLPHTQRICTALHCAVSCTLTHLITRRSAPLRAVP